MFIKKSFWLVAYFIWAILACNQRFSNSKAQYEIMDFDDSIILGRKVRTNEVIYNLQEKVSFTLKLGKKKIEIKVRNESSNKIICIGNNWDMFSTENRLTFVSAPDINNHEPMNIKMILPKKDFNLTFNLPDSIAYVSIGNYFITLLPSNMKIDSLLSNQKLYHRIPFKRYPENKIDYFSIENIDSNALKPDNPLTIFSN